MQLSPCLLCLRSTAVRPSISRMNFAIVVLGVTTLMLFFAFVRINHYEWQIHYPTFVAKLASAAGQQRRFFTDDRPRSFTNRNQSILPIYRSINRSINRSTNRSIDRMDHNYVDPAYLGAMKTFENVKTVKPPKVIVWYTPIFGVPRQPDFFLDCPDIKYLCVRHSIKEEIGSADAVIFHERDTSGNITELNAISRKPHQRFVFYTSESPMNSNHPIGGFPENFFNWTVTYLPSSDIVDPYGWGWIGKEQAEKLGTNFRPPIIGETEIAKTRSSLIVGTISNCVGQRLNFLKSLNRTIPVKLVGRCAWQRELVEACPRGNSDKCIRNLIESSFFFIALENSICNWYTSEKYFSRAHFNSVPILWSRRSSGHRLIPEKSAIFVEDYRSIEELADHLVYLTRNASAYREYFNWRQFVTAAPNPSRMECQLCRKLLSDEGATKFYADPMKWYNEESQCNFEIPQRLSGNRGRRNASVVD